jgi:hypothetical protein
MSFWTTFEVNYWSKGLSYNQYLEDHGLLDLKHVPLSEQGYLALCKLLDEEIKLEWSWTYARNVP